MLFCHTGTCIQYFKHYRAIPFILALEHEDFKLCLYSQFRLYGIAVEVAQYLFLTFHSAVNTDRQIDRQIQNNCRLVWRAWPAMNSLTPFN